MWIFLEEPRWLLNSSQIRKFGSELFRNFQFLFFLDFFPFSPAFSILARSGQFYHHHHSWAFRGWRYFPQVQFAGVSQVDTESFRPRAVTARESIECWGHCIHFCRENSSILGYAKGHIFPEMFMNPAAGRCFHWIFFQKVIEFGQASLFFSFKLWNVNMFNFWCWLLLYPRKAKDQGNIYYVPPRGCPRKSLNDLEKNENSWELSHYFIFALWLIHWALDFFSLFKAFPTSSEVNIKLWTIRSSEIKEKKLLHDHQNSFSLFLFTFPVSFRSLVVNLRKKYVKRMEGMERSWTCFFSLEQPCQALRRWFVPG